MGMEEGEGSGWIVLKSKHSKGVCYKAKKMRILAEKSEPGTYQKEKNKKATCMCWNWSGSTCIILLSWTP
jgi:hypothetical protein